MRRDHIITALNVVYDVFFSVLIVTLSIHLLNAPPRGAKPCLDFSAFYLAGRLALDGAAASAYSAARMTAEISAFCGMRIVMPWTYPPPFDLVVAPLSRLPFGAAYGLFAMAAYIFYCLMLRRLSATERDFFIVRLIAAPAIFLTLICGQSSLMVAGLIGWFCLVLLGEAGGGGAPLGLLVIKPHLAVSAVILTAIDKRFGLLAQAAAMTLLLVIAATLAFGVEIWPAFLSAGAEARRFLNDGAVYPLFRMISVFAAAYTFGKTLALAFTLQGLFSLLCAWAIFRASRLGDRRVAVGVVALVAAGFSPYAYDYDLATLGVGAALLLPTLSVATNLIEKASLLFLYLFAILYGLFFSPLLASSVPTSADEPLKEIVRNISTQRLSPGGIAYASLALCVLYILLRGARGAARINPIAAQG